MFLLPIRYYLTNSTQFGSQKGRIKADQLKLAGAILFIPLFDALRRGDQIPDESLPQPPVGSPAWHHEQAMINSTYRDRQAYHAALGLPPPQREDCVPSRNALRHFMQVLRFCVALKYLSARKISLNQLRFGSDLLESLCITYVDMNIHLPPNFHNALHIESDIEKTGAVYNTWAYGPERANGILASVNTNGHGQGVLSETLLRDWCRFPDLVDLVSRFGTYKSAANWISSSFNVWIRCQIRMMPILKRSRASSMH
jgi:hypothetical protein